MYNVTFVCASVVPAEVKPASMEPCPRLPQPDESKHATSSSMDVGKLLYMYVFYSVVVGISRCELSDVFCRFLLQLLLVE